MIFDKNFSYAFNENACEKCGGKCCTGESGNIFASKEEQCRTFPFWEYFKTHQKELEKECIGICYLSW